MQQIVPPMVVVRNENPKLTAEPTVVVPPQIHLARITCPTSVIPWRCLARPPTAPALAVALVQEPAAESVRAEARESDRARVAVLAAAYFTWAEEFQRPKPVYSPDPEYSEEARKAKYQGVCVLWLVVGPDGRPRDIRVTRTLGLGLDEKAIEAVKTWKFEPAMKDGKPVSVEISVQVDFHLY